MFKGMAWEPYFRAVEAIMDENGGRPHWGKRHFQTAETLRPRDPGAVGSPSKRSGPALDPDGSFTSTPTPSASSAPSGRAPVAG